jgi:vacuolar protein sorting-associated protein 13A/C
VGLVNERQAIATFALSTADLSVMLVGDSMTIEGRLGNLSLTDDLSPMQDQILSIEGNNFAELKYQTFDSTSPSFNGINSEVDLRSASVKLHFLAKPLQNLYRFATKFAQLKGLYDAATQVAAQRASEISRMKFFVSIESPIIVFPCDAPATNDFLLMKLGRFTGQNDFTRDNVSTTISLNGIHLESVFFEGENSSTLSIIEDVNVNVVAEQSSQGEKTPDNMQADTKVRHHLENDLFS